MLFRSSAEFRCNLNGRLQVARSRNSGKTWTLLSNGLPQKNVFVTVLRESMASDSLDPAGVYFGTANGQLYYTRDAGDRWRLMAEHLPPVYSVSVAVEPRPQAGSGARRRFRSIGLALLFAGERRRKVAA